LFGPPLRVRLRVMARLNLTLDVDTYSRLSKRAKLAHAQRATFARLLLREALDRREAVERARRLARDYSDGRKDALELLEDWEPLGLEIVGREGD
jgi:hypothetical protein